jgi:hypothetical protein
MFTMLGVIAFIIIPIILIVFIITDNKKEKKE